MMIRATSTEVSLYTGGDAVLAIGVVLCAVVGVLVGVFVGVLVGVLVGALVRVLVGVLGDVLGVVLGDVGFGVVDFSSVVTVEDGSVEGNQGFGQSTDIGGSYLGPVSFLGQAYGEISRKYWKIEVMQQTVK